MKPNPKKFQFMILGKGSRLPVILNINNIKIRGESQKVILLGLTIDHCLTFKDHIDTLCHNASCKLHALRRIRKYLTPDKAKNLYNAFINSQFSYASVIWMFCRKTDYLKMEKVQYKALKLFLITMNHLRIFCCTAVKYLFIKKSYVTSIDY